MNISLYKENGEQNMCKN